MTIRPGTVIDEWWSGSHCNLGGGRTPTPAPGWRPLAAKVTELGAADDTELVSAAEAVLALLNNTGKYIVTVHDSKRSPAG